HRRELDDLEYRPRWVVFDRLFSGAVEDVEAPWTLNTPWLRGSAMGVGIALAFIGFVAFARVYRGLGSRPGIAVGGAGLAVFGDVIALTGGCLGAVGCIEAFWVGVLELPSLLGYVPEYSLGSALSPYAFISILGMGLGMPFFTFWITVLTGQRVHVDSEGVTSWGVFGRSYVPWDELEMIHVREQRSAAMWTTGDYRALQRVLEIEGENTSITINQPTSAKRKASILVALLEHIPAGLRHLLEVADDW
ncbi:MAG: hypothetical protein GY906_17315, partial [bacterium]|nr:hypothetical protein [bacterium]